MTDTLRNELKSNRTAHAYLFTGSRGTGKTTCSKILAKAVNCLHLQDGDPCGECEICRGIDDGSIMDIVEIDAASNNGVDDVRLLREEASFTPANTKYRVYIIDEVHMLSIGAFNALLKTLEEPPPHVVFILATTEVHKLPATIMSRCQRFDFHRIAPDDIAARLESVCEQENVGIDHTAAMLIAGIADGAMRDALSLLDQCMGHGRHITEEMVRSTAGLADQSHLIGFTDALLEKDAAKAVSMIGELYAASKDMARLCEELTEHFRSIMLIKTMRQPQNYLMMSESEYEKTKQQADKMKLSFVVSSIDVLQSAAEKMLRGANRRTEMEMTAVKLCMSEQQKNDTSSLETRIAALEKAVGDLKIHPPVPTGQKTEYKRTYQSSAAVKRPSQSEMEKLRKEALPMTQWPEIVEEIKQYSITNAAGFEGSTAYISGQYVLVDSDKDICFEQLRNSELRARMRDAIKRITGREYKLGRYSYPDEKKSEDALTQLMSDFQSAGIPVENIH